MYYHRDHQNSILSLTDKEGKIIESYNYDAYGNITYHTKTAETYNPYGYTGRETDTDDLYYYRARYYDPTIGRFITPDPIGFAGGDTNFYRYVGNDPVNFVDPSGLVQNGTPSTSVLDTLSNTFDNFNKGVQNFFSPNPNKSATVNKGDGGKSSGTASQDCMIINAYFAKRTKQDVLDRTVDYIFKGNNNTSGSHKESVAKAILKNIGSAYSPSHATVQSIKEALTQDSYKAKDKITFKLYKEQEVSVRITEASIGEKVTLVATLGGCPAGQNVTFKIYEKSPMLTTAGKELIMLKDGVEVTEVSVASKGTYAAIEVELRPKKDRKSSATDTSPSLELWQEKFKHTPNTPEKFDHLWLKVSCPSAKNKEMNCLQGSGEALKVKKMGLMFPLDHIPHESYKEVPRMFGSKRDGGKRKHAGCDLYAPVGTKIYAMADGIIIGYNDFYGKTYEITVDHGDFIIRYGEVKPKPDGIAPNLHNGSIVKQGQHIGYVGLVHFKNGGTAHMLHLEIYDKSKNTWPLTNKSNPPYYRQKSLLDPTSFLDQASTNLPKGN